MAKYGTCKICGQQSKSISKHELKCELRQNFLNYYGLDKEKIKLELDSLGSILSFIEKYPLIFNSKKNQYYDLFKFFKIDCSIKKSSNHKNIKIKKAKTSLEKYGYEHNFCKNHPSRIKWEKKLLESEGITNVFQRQEVKDKSLATVIMKYGSKQKRGFLQRGKSISTLNKWLYKTLNDLNIEYQAEFAIKRHKGLYYFDCILINTNKLIEINGDYWHANPKIYKPNDLILKGSSGEIMAKNKWLSDKRKINYAKKNGFEVLTIWELDIKLNERQEIQRIIDYAKN
jgi:hypothetical protein